MDDVLGRAKSRLYFVDSVRTRLLPAVTTERMGKVLSRELLMLRGRLLLSVAFSLLLRYLRRQ